MFGEKLSVYKSPARGGEVVRIKKSSDGEQHDVNVEENGFRSVKQSEMTTNGQTTHGMSSTHLQSALGPMERVGARRTLVTQRDEDFGKIISCAVKCGFLSSSLMLLQLMYSHIYLVFFPETCLFV